MHWSAVCLEQHKSEGGRGTLVTSHPPLFQDSALTTSDSGKAGSVRSAVKKAASSETQVLAALSKATRSLGNCDQGRVKPCCR